MSIIVSTSCLNSYSRLTDLVLDLLARGLTHIELSASPPVTEDELIRLSDLGAHFNVHNYFPPANPPFVLNLASQNPAILAASLNLAKRAIDLTAAFGSSFYAVHAGMRTEIDPSSLGECLNYGSVVDYDTAYTQMVNSLRSLCDYAQRQGITIAVEPNVITAANLVDGRNELLLICEAWEVQALIRDVARPDLGVLLDTGHLAVTAATLRFDRWRFIEQVAPYVLAIHVSDNDGTADTHQPVRSGSWVLDVLRQPKFSNLPVIVEAKFDSAAALRQHVNWLEAELGRE